MSATEEGSLSGYIHQWVPAVAPGEPSRVLLLLHGTGGDETDLLPLGKALDPTAALLSPRGNVLERGMPRFFRRLSEGVYDLDDVRKRATELVEFVAYAARHYKFDPARLTAAGFSNGANIAAAILLLHPEVLRSAILLSPMMPLEPEVAPDLHGTRVFVGAGRFDAIAPPDQVEKLVRRLRAAGAEVALHWASGGHGIDQEELGAARKWLGEPDGG
jgi:predicted esterase